MRSPRSHHSLFGRPAVGRHDTLFAPLEGRADGELVLLARAGDDLALAVLLTRYRGLARAKARPYFLAGGDRDDVVQEAMIGLYKAIRDFDPSREVAFAAFADLCVTRQVISAVKSAARHKHGPLNASVSLDRPVGGEGDQRVLGDTLPTPATDDPAEQVASAERIRGLQQHLDSVLSDLEVDVLRLFVEGRSYAEIAEHLHRQVKAIDNAIQRVRRKIELHLRERTLAEAG